MESPARHEAEISLKINYLMDINIKQTAHQFKFLETLLGLNTLIWFLKGVKIDLIQVLYMIAISVAVANHANTWTCSQNRILQRVISNWTSRPISMLMVHTSQVFIATMTQNLRIIYLGLKWIIHWMNRRSPCRQWSSWARIRVNRSYQASTIHFKTGLIRLTIGTSRHTQRMMIRPAWAVSIIWTDQ